MKPTIKDIAKKIDVSVATVSRVINNRSGYSLETEKKVLKAIDKLGYCPNALARGLVGKKIKTIGVLMPSVSSMVASKILKGIEDAAHNRNYSVIICNTDNSGKRTINYLRVLREKQIDGIIVVSEILTDEYINVIKKMEVQVTLVSTIAKESNNFTYIKVDDIKAAYQTTEYLINKGHKNIAMISGTKDDVVAGIPRVKGYLKALEDYGLPKKKENLVYGDFSFDSGKICMEKLFKQSSKITAVFAASDEMAIGALSAAYRHRINVPEQLSVIGYDNTKLAQMTVPPLTVLSQPFYQMGYEGLSMLISKIKGENVESKILPHIIIERQTVKDINR
jgi:LacI family transcriptional regulator